MRSQILLSTLLLIGTLTGGGCGSDMDDDLAYAIASSPGYLEMEIATADREAFRHLSDEDTVVVVGDAEALEVVAYILRGKSERLSFLMDLYDSRRWSERESHWREHSIRVPRANDIDDALDAAGIKAAHVLTMSELSARLTHGDLNGEENGREENGTGTF